MAFNPFNFFRKYQKVFFGILAIICMFVFVLQFGRGDPFSKAIAWFGLSRAKGATVATVYGQTVKEGQISKLQADRQLATEFLFEMLHANIVRVMKPEPSRTGSGSIQVPAGAQVLEKIPGTLGLAAKGILEQIRQRGERNPLDPDAAAQTEVKIRRDLDVLRDALLFNRTADGKSSEYGTLDSASRAALDDLLVYLQYELYIYGNGSNFPDLYYGVSFFDPSIGQFHPNRGTNKTFFMGGGRSTEELLDFLVWKHQADTLGVSLTEKGVLFMALTYTGNKAGTQSETFAGDKRVQDFVARRQAHDREQTTAKDLQAALLAEFRVALARETVVGRPVPGTFPALGLNLLPTTPAQTSTLGAFQKFRDLTTTEKIGLLEIPVEAFLAQVEEKGLKPTEQQLQELFDKYKNDEPTPDRSRPGFKEPRRVQVQYLHISGESPFIRDQARRIRLAGDALMPLGTALGAVVPGSNPLLAAVNVSALREDFLLLKEYERYKEEPGNTLESWLNTENHFGEAYHARDTSWLREGSLRSLVGNLFAASLVQGSPFAPLVAFRGVVEAYDAGDLHWQSRELTPRLIDTLATVGALGVTGSGGIGQNATALGLALSLQPNRNHKPVEFLEPLPFKVILPVFKYNEQAAQMSDIRTKLLRDAYEEIRKDRGKTEADAWPGLKKYFEARNLLPFVHTTPYGEDAYSLGKDPALANLVQVADKAFPAGRPRPASSASDLVVNMVFQTRGTYDPLRWSPKFAQYRQRLLQTRQFQQQLQQRFAGQFPGERLKSDEEINNEATEQSLRDTDAVLVWRSEDRNSEVPKTLDDFVWLKDKRVKVRTKVVAAWKYLQAQRLAEDYAAKLRDEVKKLKGTQNIEATVQWLRDRKPGTFKELRDVGRLQEVTPSGTVQIYRPYQVPHDVIEFPRADMVDTLMKHLDDVGAATLVADEPIQHWYVALCQTRNERSITAFLNASSEQSQGLFDRFYTAHTVPVEEKAYAEKLIKRLRTEAGKDSVDAAGHWRIPTDVKATYERSDSE